MTSTPPIINLTPPRLDEDCIAQRITCIRPKRAKALKLEGQIVDGKLIMHNYGAGGIGWTLLFGLVDHSVRQFEELVASNPQFANRPIRIIGAGCMGLYTAIGLHKKGYQVAITAKEIEDITSYKAAGIVAPSKITTGKSAHEAALIERLALSAYATYMAIANGTHPYISAGARHIPLYAYPGNDDTDFTLTHYVTAGLISPPTTVMIDFGTGKRYQVAHYETLFIDTVTLMNRLHDLCRTAGIVITKAHVTHFNDLVEDVIFNCSGLGATALNSDAAMVPVQGHLIALKHQPAAPAHEYIIHARVQTVGRNGYPRTEYVYFVPKGEGMLGTSYITCQAGLDTNAHEFDRILQRARNFF